MAWRFVVQPNGLLARFSEVVDAFTHFNLNDATAIEVARADACCAHDAQLKIDRARANKHRWAEALDIVEAIHGVSKRRRVELDYDEATTAPRRARRRAR